MSSSISSASGESSVTEIRNFFPAGLLGVVICIFSALVFLGAATAAAVQRIFDADQAIARAVVWYVGAPLLLGISLVVFDAIVLAPKRRGDRTVITENIDYSKVTVVLTAYNDEASIGQSVLDFIENDRVQRVIVVDNNSSDKTSEEASNAGATVVIELRPGYGNCVYRALEEGSKYKDTNAVVLCEGDMTFRSSDLDKLIAYLPHGDVVNGTRIVEQLRNPGTQLTSFMYFGNFFTAKLLEYKYLGRGTISDVGTTYKVCKSDFLRTNLTNYDRNVNLEFNAHFLDVTMRNSYRLIEAPITFHPRVGESKGGNVSNIRALLVGLRMMRGIIFGWKGLSTKEINHG